jgi:hypothetical protein
MADDTKKVGGTTAPTEVKGPQGRGAPPPKPEETPQVQTNLDPARTGVVDRKVEGVGALVTSRPMPAEAAEKIDRAAAIRADIGKSKEQLEADKLEREANDAIARQANEDAEARGEIRGTTVAEAKMAAAPLVGADVLASDHYAQKFGNDPRNPKLAPGLSPDNATVMLSRKTPDHPDLVYALVNPEMVGDYERAGWNRAA